MVKDCSNCANSDRPPYDYPCNVCGGARFGFPPTMWEEKKKPMTNGDKIRSMSNDELAAVVGHNTLCEYIQGSDHKFCEARAVCGDCIRDWLKQPAKEV